MTRIKQDQDSVRMQWEGGNRPRPKRNYLEIAREKVQVRNSYYLAAADFAFWAFVGAMITVCYLAFFA